MQSTKRTSPDGKYDLWLDGEHFAGQKIVLNEIASSNPTVILENKYDSEKTQIGNFSLASPIWSPDSQEIAYLRLIIRSSNQFEVDIQIDLHTINLDGTDDKLIKENIEVASGHYSSTDLKWDNQGINYTDVSLLIKSEKVTVPIN